MIVLLVIITIFVVVAVVVWKSQNFLLLFRDRTTTFFVITGSKLGNLNVMQPVWFKFSYSLDINFCVTGACWNYRKYCWNT